MKPQLGKQVILKGPINATVRGTLIIESEFVQWIINNDIYTLFIQSKIFCAPNKVADVCSVWYWGFHFFQLQLSNCDPLNIEENSCSGRLNWSCS